MINKKITMTWQQWENAKNEADKKMKRNSGHYYEKILKTRCIWCKRSPKNTRRCGAWFQTFIKRLDEELLNLNNKEEKQ